MTDEKRLIELIVRYGCEEYGGNSKCDGDCFARCKDCTTGIRVGDLAKELVANGVTVQKWIPVTERLPEHDDTVLCFWESMRGTSAQIQVNKGWNIYGNITHWMPLPEPPKEGE